LQHFFISSVFSYSPVTDVRGPDERYIYEKPLCSSVSQCSDLEGCDGKIFTGKTGEITLNGYQNHFSCRWEVRGPAGSKIKVKVLQGESFGIENHNACGNDRLHIHSIDEKRFGRLCSSKNNSKLPYNGMQPGETHGGVKIQSSKFRDWLSLDTNHLVVAFDSDQNANGQGFVLQYEIDGDVPEEPVLPTVQAELEEIGNQVEEGLDNLITSLPKFPDQRKNRLAHRVKRLFEKFDTRMSRCKNGPQTDALSSVSLHGFSTGNLDIVEDQWMNLFRNSFNNCDLPIIRNHGSFDNTNWPKRIRSVIAAFRKAYN